MKSWLLITLLLAQCSPAPTVDAGRKHPKPTPTATAIPTASPTPTPTATPTATPIPTATATTTSTPSLPTNIVISWQANPTSEKVTHYNVYELISGVYNLISSTNVTSYVMPAPGSGTHSYVVSAVNSAGEGPYSDQVSYP